MMATARYANSKSISEINLLKEQARKERRNKAAALAKSQASHKKHDGMVFNLEPRKPQDSSFLSKMVYHVLGEFDTFRGVIQRKEWGHYLGLDSSEPGTPEVTTDTYNEYPPKYAQPPPSAVKMATAKEPATATPVKKEFLSPKKKKGIKKEKVKPPDLKMTNSLNASASETTITPTKIETILKEMTRETPASLTEIQTPRGGDEFFPSSKVVPTLNSSKTVVSSKPVKPVEIAKTGNKRRNSKSVEPTSKQPIKARTESVSSVSSSSDDEDGSSSSSSESEDELCKSNNSSQKQLDSKQSAANSGTKKCSPLNNNYIVDKTLNSTSTDTDVCLLDGAVSVPGEHSFDAYLNKKPSHALDSLGDFIHMEKTLSPLNDGQFDKLNPLFNDELLSSSFNSLLKTDPLPPTDANAFNLFEDDPPVVSPKQQNNLLTDHDFKDNSLILSKKPSGYNKDSRNNNIKKDVVRKDERNKSTDKSNETKEKSKSKTTRISSVPTKAQLKKMPTPFPPVESFPHLSPLNPSPILSQIPDLNSEPVRLPDLEPVISKIPDLKPEPILSQIPDFFPPNNAPPQCTDKKTFSHPLFSDNKYAQSESILNSLTKSSDLNFVSPMTSPLPQHNPMHDLLNATNVVDDLKPCHLFPTSPNPTNNETIKELPTSPLNSTIVPPEINQQPLINQPPDFIHTPIEEKLIETSHQEFATAYEKKTIEGEIKDGDIKEEQIEEEEIREETDFAEYEQHDALINNNLDLVNGHGNKVTDPLTEDIKPLLDTSLEDDVKKEEDEENNHFLPISQSPESVKVKCSPKEINGELHKPTRDLIIRIPLKRIKLKRHRRNVIEMEEKITTPPHVIDNFANLESVDMDLSPAPPDPPVDDGPVENGHHDNDDDAFKSPNDFENLIIKINLSRLKRPPGSRVDKNAVSSPKKKRDELSQRNYTEPSPQKVPLASTQEASNLNKTLSIKKKRGRPKKDSVSSAQKKETLVVTPKKDLQNQPEVKREPVETKDIGVVTDFQQRECNRCLASNKTPNPKDYKNYRSFLENGTGQKRNADRLNEEPTKQAHTYISAVLNYVKYLVGIEVDGKLNAKQGIDDYLKMCSDCINLMDYVLGQLQNQSKNVDRKYLYLSFKLQSILHMKVYSMRKDSANKCKKVMSHYFKQYKPPSKIPGGNRGQSNDTPSSLSPSQQASGPSPGGSVNSIGSAGSSDGQQRSDNKMMSSIPSQMHEKAYQYYESTRHLLEAHKLWDYAQANAAFEGYIMKLSSQVGELTIHSTMHHLCLYINHGLLLITTHS